MTIRHPLRDRHKKRKKGDTAQLAAQLAPLEEQDKQAARRQQGANGHGAGQNGGRLIQEQGALIIDTDHLNLAAELTETRNEKAWVVEPVVLVIVCAVLAFIAFIAWQISLMPRTE